MMHAKLGEFIAYAAREGVRCSFFTNGVDSQNRLFSRKRWQQLADQGLETIDFSAHQVDVETFATHMGDIVRIDRVFDPQRRELGTWAGQTGEPEIPVVESCLFEKKDAFVVLWDGRISSCCLDVEGQLEQMFIDDLLSGRPYRFSSISLCSTCSSMRHEESL